MGQSASAIYYGITESEFDFDAVMGEDGAGGIVDTFHEAQRIDTLNGRCIQTPYEANKPVLGVLVAIGGSGKAGAADIRETRALDEIPEVKEAKAAVKLWGRFAKFAAGRGVTLPPAKFYLTTDETA